MKHDSEKELTILLGLGICLTASALVVLAARLAEKNLDTILKKLNMKEDISFIDDEELSEDEVPLGADDMFEE